MSDKEAKAELKAAKAKAKAMRPWYKKKRIILSIIFAIAVISSVANQGGSTNSSSTNSETTQTEETTNSDSSTANETVSQANAKRSAENYLSISAFSRSGLIKQLVFEGYSKADAEYGVDAQNADWNEQAAKSGENYLSISAFSRKSLIAQLKFDGFTQSEAEYGATKNGL